jgi:hypothetical protein
VALEDIFSFPAIQHKKSGAGAFVPFKSLFKEILKLCLGTVYTSVGRKKDINHILGLSYHIITCLFHHELGKEQYETQRYFFLQSLKPSHGVLQNCNWMTRRRQKKNRKKAVWLATVAAA